MSNPRYTAVESQFTISPPQRSARATASVLFPVAVGPRIATSGGIAGDQPQVLSNRARTSTTSTVSSNSSPTWWERDGNAIDQPSGDDRGHPPSNAGAAGGRRLPARRLVVVEGHREEGAVGRVLRWQRLRRIRC